MKKKRKPQKQKNKLGVKTALLEAEAFSQYGVWKERETAVAA